MASGYFPPINFKTLQQAIETRSSDKKLVNAIGVVSSVQYTPPGANRGTDACLGVELRDPSIGVTDGSNYFRIKFFIKPNQSRPPIDDIGDVIIIRQFKYVGSNFVSNYSTRVFVFKVNQLSTALLTDGTNRIPIDLKYISDLPNLLEPTDEEKRYVMFLWRWTSSLGGQITARSANIPTDISSVIAANAQNPQRRKQALLSEVRADKFCNLTVEVVKIWKHYEITTIYVTDYTSNNMFHQYNRDEDEDDGLNFNSNDPAYEIDQNTGKRVWKGPSGKMTLQISLWSPHAEFVNENVTEGAKIDLQNVQIAHHRNVQGVIEGKLRGDRSYPNKVYVSLANQNSQVYKDLIERKDAHWKKNLQPEKPVLTKGQKKREKGKKKKQEQKALEDQQNNGDPFTAAKTSILNGYVTAGYEDKGFQSLFSIMHSSHLHGKLPSDQGLITYPFMNVAFKTKVRAVDFFPPRIEDFTQCIDNPDYNDQVDQNDDEMDLDSSPSRRWEWAFWLLLEDINPSSRGYREKVRVLVSDLDADYLLRLDACE